MRGEQGLRLRAVRAAPTSNRGTALSDTVSYICPMSSTAQIISTWFVTVRPTFEDALLMVDEALSKRLVTPDEYLTLLLAAQSTLPVSG